ncbi:MAG: PAS domain S-box protein [Desulfobacterales bacterium]
MANGQSALLTDSDKSREQLIQELAEYRSLLAAREQQCRELFEETVCLRSGEAAESQRLFRTAADRLPDILGGTAAGGQVVEEAPSHQGELLQRIFDTIPVMLILWDPRLRRFTLNHHAEEVLGWTTADANQGDFMSKAYPDAAYRAEVADSMQSLAPGWREWIVTTKDGRRVPGDWFNTRLSNDTMIGFGLDLRDRKKAERALRDSEGAARERLAEIESIYTNAPVGLCVLDTELRYVRINARLAEINGVPAAAHIGRTVREIVPGLADDIEPQMRRILATGEPVLGIEISGETAAQPGVRRTWIESWLPLKDADGTITGLNLVAQEITAQKKAEAVLRESEERWAVTLASIGDAVIATDTQGRVTYLNQVAESLTGWRSSEALGQPTQAVFRIVNEHTRKVVESPVNKVLQTGRVAAMANHTVLLRRDGSEVPIDDSGAPIRDREGNVLGAVLVFRDISERRLTEKRLQESEATFRAVAELNPFGMWECDPQGDLVYLSPSWLEMTGMSLAQCRDFGWMDRYAPGEGEKMLASWRRCIETEGRWEYEHHFYDKDGGDCWILGRGFPMRDAAGRITKWVGLNIDITAQKRAALALLASERHLRDVMDNMVAMIGLMTPDGTLVEANRTALAAANLKPGDVLGRPFEECYWWSWSRDVQQRLRTAIEEAAAGKGSRYDEVIRVADGEFLTIDFMLSPMVDGDGRVSFLIPSATDITDRKRAEEALRQVNDTLEQRVAERTELAEARSRQLQALAVELVEAEERERRRIAQLLHDDLQQILAAARLQLQCVPDSLPSTSMLASVERLLEESIEKSRRLSHELSPPVLNHSGLVAALQWLAGQMNAQFGLRVQLTTDAAGQFDSSPLNVFMFRAAQELLFNVVKHANVKNARVELRGSDEGLIIVVSDQGQGFDPGGLDHFNEKAGFGLLSLRERARHIGGSLTIDSAPGRGSCFTLRVPLGPVKRAETQRLAVKNDPAGSLTAGIASAEAVVTRVLFVDDHRVMRQGLIQLISGQPHIQVAGEAANGLEAVEKARQLKPDVIVMDVSMPELDGIEATRRIKAELPDVRVIGLSMYEDDQLARTMRQAGAEAFVSKTASSADLLKAIYGMARPKQARPSSG